MYLLTDCYSNYLLYFNKCFYISRFCTILGPFLLVKEATVASGWNMNKWSLIRELYTALPFPIEMILLQCMNSITRNIIPLCFP